MNSEYRRINLVRFALMLFVCIVSYGFPTQYGGYVRILSGFSSIAFYIFSGFLISRENEPLDKKLLRAIRRTALLALGMLVLNLVANTVYYAMAGVSILDALSELFHSRRLLFEFVVMSIWHMPLGENFWFIQSLLYAYIAMYLLEKCHLLKFDWIIFIALMVLTVLTGELAGVVRFSFLGYQYIPANVLTRALPYLLLGKILRKLREEIVSMNISPASLLLVVLVGAGFSIGELLTLNILGKLVYTGHLLGNGIMAAGICMVTIMQEYKMGNRSMPILLEDNLRWYTTFIYATHQLIGFAITLLVLRFAPQLMNSISYAMAFLVFAVSALLAVLVKLGWDKLQDGILSKRTAEKTVEENME